MTDKILIAEQLAEIERECSSKTLWTSETVQNLLATVKYWQNRAEAAENRKTDRQIMEDAARCG